MRILLISSPTGFDSTLSKVHSLPSIGVYRLQYFLQKHGFDCDILDTDIEDINTFILCKTKEYDIIGISGTYFSIDACMKYVALIINSQTNKPFLFAGGVTPTYAPKLWLDIGFQAVILGYGEYPILELCKALQTNETNKNNVFKNFDNIEGISYYSDGDLVVNHSKKMNNDFFKEVTFYNMLHSVIPYEKYWKYNEQFLETFSKKNFYFSLKSVNIYTSSHCPNRCGYCNGKFLDEAQQSKLPIYFLDADEILALTKNAIQKYNPNLIYFSDDDFLFSKKRAITFAEKVIAAKRQGDIPQGLDFGCQSRVVNLLKNGEPDLPFIRLLADAGFKPITVGAESCVSRLLETPLMNKRGYAKAQVFSLAQALLDNKIYGGVNFMLMLPDATREDVLFDLHCAYELLLKGIEIRVTMRVMSQYGAPAINMREYATENKNFISPLNGHSFDLPQYFKNKNKELSDVMTRCEHLLPKIETFLNEKYFLKARKRNSFYAISRCLALAEALDDNELCCNFHHAAELWFKDE